MHTYYIMNTDRGSLLLRFCSKARFQVCIIWCSS